MKYRLNCFIIQHDRDEVSKKRIEDKKEITSKTSFKIEYDYDLLTLQALG